MKTGPNGLALIKHFESCRLEAFKPVPTDPWTIGWGHTDGVQEYDTCSQEQADDMLAADLAWCEDAVSTGVHIPITQNQHDAMVSLIYNIGANNFESSTLRRILNTGAIHEAAEQFPRWDKSAGEVLAGLTRRREAERKLFLTPDDEKFLI